MDFLLQIGPLLPEMALAFFALALLVTGIFYGDGVTRQLVRLGAFLLLGVAAIVAAFGFGGAYASPPLAGYGMLKVDGFAAVMKVLLLASGASALYLAPRFLDRHGVARAEYPVLVMLATLGMMLMVSAHHFLMLYLGLELQSLALYVLAAFQRDTVRSSEAGLKYFILGALASGFLLYGISLLYGFTGTLDFEKVRQVLLSGGGVEVKLALLFVVVALAFKISAAPFHMWAPDVYEGAPTPVTAFFAVAPKVAAFGLLMRVLFEPLKPVVADWQAVLAVLAALSMLVGAFGALGQANLKRLLAYSSIGHVGFVLMGVAAANQAGVEAAIVYLVFYVVMTLAAFALLLAMYRDGKLVEGVADLAGISQRHPGFAFIMGAVMLSMAGIPPLVGFFTKVYVLMAAVDAGLVWLAVAGVLLSVVSAFYYLRVVKVMYFDEAGPCFEHPFENSSALVMVVAGAFTIVGVVMVSPISVLARYAAQSLIP